MAAILRRSFTLGKASSRLVLRRGKQGFQCCFLRRQVFIFTNKCAEPASEFAGNNRDAGRELRGLAALLVALKIVLIMFTEHLRNG